MGGNPYLRDGWKPRAERVVHGLQGFPPQIDEARIVADEADEPNSLADFLDFEPPAGKALTGAGCGSVDFGGPFPVERFVRPFPR